MLPKPVMADLADYLGQLRRFPILEAKDEARLIKRWREDSDCAAAPTSHEPTAPCRHGRAFTQVHACQYLPDTDFTRPVYWPIPFAIPSSSHRTILAPYSSKP
jgi:hypothetical protein